MMSRLILFWSAYLAAGAMLWLVARYLGTRLSRLTPSTDAQSLRCGRCGYDVRGLPGDICPECGCDLNQIGRITPRVHHLRHRIAGPARAAWLAVAAMGALAFTWAASVGHFVPHRQIGHQVNPAIAFTNSGDAQWPFLVVVTYDWDRDESAAPLSGWFPRRQQRGELSGSDNTGTFPPVIDTRPYPHLTWDALANRWTLAVPGLPARSGVGWPPLPNLEQWTAAVVNHRPASAPLTPAQFNGLTIAAGDQLASADRGGFHAWTADRLNLVARGYVPITLATIGGQFRNDIWPWFPPLIGGVLFWMGVIAAGVRQFRSANTAAALPVGRGGPYDQAGEDGATQREESSATERRE